MRLPWAFCRAIASEFGRQNSLRRARIRGGGAPTRGAPTGGFFGARAPRGEGAHKGCPYGMLAASGGFVAGGCSCPGRSVGQSHLNSDAKIVYEGRAHGGEGTHKGCPYGMLAASGGFVPSGMQLPWAFCRAIASEFGRQNSRRGARTRGGRGGHPQGVPLRDSGSLRRFCRWWMRLAWAFCRAIAFEFRRQNSRRWARTRGGRGTHKGCPYGILAA